ncbi:dienelactone hydrolase family protein [Nocardioides sp. BP30]|uniref:dienelactone hydrolase family protein n=1 Tax=Nocardioides sp. BP30 TaxID=3036374 RepID=UPI00246945AE|nr:dienelactone hydrolase family protein [Nocardioides sp. BP30]WGL53112.1 dienelactone hydrolase family protein [Nocardioides sp. BP30]
MAEILLLHHARGLTDGVHHFADTLREAGHTVHTPDLYEGRLFSDTEAGVAHMRALGDEVLSRRAAAAEAGLPTAGLVYAGMSMGCGYATWLALKHRPGSARAMLYLFGAPDPRWFETEWPEGLPAVAHQTIEDPWRELSEDAGFRDRVPGGRLIDYSGSGHLFLDDSTEDYDPVAARQAQTHILAWLDALP